jgi:hypothetical protein
MEIWEWQTKLRVVLFTWNFPTASQKARIVSFSKALAIHK